MATEAEAAVLVAAIVNVPKGSSGGSVALSAAMKTEVQAWFDTGIVKSVAACTFTDAGDLVTRVAHGYVAGNVVEFPTVVTTTGISANTEYFVIAAGLTADAFQVSATSGGAALPLTTNGTGTVGKRVGTSAKAVLAVQAAAAADGDWASIDSVCDYAEQIIKVLP